MSGLRRHGSGRRRIAALALVVLVLLAGGAVFSTVNHYLNMINRIDPKDLVVVPPSQEDFEEDEDTGLTPIDPEAAMLSTVPEGYSVDEELLNFLLVGQDRRPGEGRQRSDSMILISINPDKKKVAMISFLRDLYVTIPGYSDNRLNAAYVFGGFPLLKAALFANFGVTVDGCFEVDFDGFRTLIDQIGGIDIELTAAESERIGKGTYEGMNHLNGKQALAYARIRKIGTDFARTNRQRTVLLAAYEKVRTKSPTELIRLLEQALPILTTDMTNAQIYATAFQLIPIVSSVSISSYYIPPDGTYYDVYIRKMAVMLPDLAMIRSKLVNEYLPI